jgi:hypothetical protein
MDISRDSRIKALSVMNKAELLRLYMPYYVGSAHPVTSWRKDELVSSILSIEYPSVDDFGATSAECPKCHTTIYGTHADIDSGLRKHLEYCEANTLDPVQILESLGAKMSPALTRNGPLTITSRDCVMCGPDTDCICHTIAFASPEYFERLDRLHGRKRNIGE